MRINFSRTFRKQYNKAPKKIQQSFDKRFKIFIKDSSNLVLNNHSLMGSLKGLKSINITGDWRAVYSQINSRIIIFEILGTHSQLYK